MFADVAAISFAVLSYNNNQRIALRGARQLLSVIDGFKVFLTDLTTIESGRIGYFDFEGSADNSTWVSLTTGFI